MWARLTLTRTTKDSDNNTTKVIKARSAHTHANGTILFTHKTKRVKTTSKPMRVRNAPPTRKELLDAHLRVKQLHKVLSSKTNVSTPDMDVEDMLSTMTLVVNEQRVLSMMYQDLLLFNIDRRVATGNNDPRRPETGAGPAIPSYGDGTAPSVQERVKLMEGERHEDLWPNCDALGPHDPIHDTLSPADRELINALMHTDRATVNADDAIRNAVAVSLVKDKFNEQIDQINGTKKGNKAVSDLLDLHDTQLAEAKASADLLVASGKTLAEKGAAMTSAPTVEFNFTAA